MIEDEEIGDDAAVKDEDTLPLYNLKQKETVKDVVVNPELNAAQQKEVRELLSEYSEISVSYTHLTLPTIYSV